MKRLVALLVLALAGCSSAMLAGHSRRRHLVESRISVGDIQVVVMAAEQITTDQQSVLWLGVRRGYDRWERCHGRARRRDVRVRLMVLRGAWARYERPTDTVQVALGFEARRDHESIEHEIADHRLSALAGDPHWQEYGHRLAPVCTGQVL